MDDQVHKAFDHLAQTIRKTDNPQDLVWLLQRTGEQYQEVKDKVIKVIAEGVRDRERFGQGVSWLLEKPADALTLALKLLEPLPDYLVDVLTPPKQPQPPGTSRFLWTGQKGSKPLEKPTAATIGIVCRGRVLPGNGHRCRRPGILGSQPAPVGRGRKEPYIPGLRRP